MSCIHNALPVVAIGLNSLSLRPIRIRNPYQENNDRSFLVGIKPYLIGGSIYDSISEVSIVFYKNNKNNKNNNKLNINHIMAYAKDISEDFLKLGNKLINILQEFLDEKESKGPMTGPIYKIGDMRSTLLRYFATLQYPGKTEVEVAHTKFKLEKTPSTATMIKHVEAMALIYNIDVKKFSSFLTLPRKKEVHDHFSKLKEEAISLYTEIRNTVSKYYEKTEEKDRKVFDEGAKIELKWMEKFPIKLRKVEKEVKKKKLEKE